MAALLSACTSDASRFDDPFANPFRGLARYDNSSKGPLRQPASRDMRYAAYDPVSTASVTPRATYAPQPMPVTYARQTMPPPSQPIIPASRPVVQGLNPSYKPETGFARGVASANYPSLAPNAGRMGSVPPPVAAPASGWTAIGGTPITLERNDTVESLSAKYGVPASAIMAVNGIAPGSRLTPGRQLMIPAYNEAQAAPTPSVAAVQRPGLQRSVTPQPLIGASARTDRLKNDDENGPRSTGALKTGSIKTPVAVKQESARQTQPKLVQALPRKATPTPVERLGGDINAAAVVARPATPTVVARRAPHRVEMDVDEDDNPVRARLAQASPRNAPTIPVRQVGAPGETEAERRAAAKLHEVKSTRKLFPGDDIEEDTRPVPRKSSASRVEDANLKAARAEAARARQAAEKARAEAARARAESDTISADGERGGGPGKTGTEKSRAERLTRSQRGESNDNSLTTGSVPPSKTATASNSDGFRWPAKGRVISGFGARSSGGNNDGINIAVPEGTPVRAADGGTVVHADDALKGYGKMVLIRHNNGYVSVYAHNGELNVKRGETVKRGQVIAHSGASGNVTSPQLHFELRKGAQPVDPTARLAD